MRSYLYTLLLIILVGWSSWAVFGLASIVVCAIVFGFALVLAARSAKSRGFWIVVLCLLFLAILLSSAVCFLPREVGRRMRCSNNLKDIMLALHNYHHAFGCFPPAYIADKNGKPMHSWRVLILPFIEHSALYKQYNFSEPWDGPHNKKLLASRPSVYVCPSDEDASREGRSLTSYVAVVGPNAAWRGTKPRSFNDAELHGKSSTTIMLVETANAGVNWTEPRDLSLDTLRSGDAPPGSVAFLSKHGWHQGLLYDYEPVSANVALADGAVMFLSARTMAAKGLRNLLTIGGFTY